MSSEPRRLLIFGARTFALEAADLVADTPDLQLTGFVENLDRERCGCDHEGRPVHWIDDVASMADSHWAICALGSTERYHLIDRAEQMGFRFATLIHPSARVSRRAHIGEGAIISAGVVVATSVHIGRHTLVNRGALIGHNVQIGDVATIGPGTNLAGFVKVGSRTYIGMSTVVVDRVSIGSRTMVAAASVVTRDVPDGVHAAGRPARVIKREVEGF